MTDTESRLLRAVLESPGDDTPRLAYADWVDDTGSDPKRAELIRVMCDERFDARCGQITHPVADMPDIACDCLTYSHPQEGVVDDWCPQCKLRHRAAQILSTRDTETDRHVLWPFTDNGWTGFNVYQYRRGFASTVRAPLAVLVGWECGRCAGHGTAERNGSDYTCRDCHGTGRVGGIGRELFERQPVERIVVTDVRPGTTDRGPEFRNYFCWEAEPFSPLWFVMRSGLLLCGHDSWRETEEECMTDLSAALVAHFREQAGLTPLA